MPCSTSAKSRENLRGQPCHEARKQLCHWDGEGGSEGGREGVREGGRAGGTEGGTMWR